MIVIIWAKYTQVNGYGGSLNLFKTSEESTGASSMPPLDQQSLWELWLSRKEGHASKTDVIPERLPNTLLCPAGMRGRPQRWMPSPERLPNTLLCSAGKRGRPQRQAPSPGRLPTLFCPACTHTSSALHSFCPSTTVTSFR